MNLSDLRNEVEKRLSRKVEIRGKVNAFCERSFGIHNFFGLVDALFKEFDFFTVCLSRQVSTANVEHVALHLFSEWLKLSGFEAKALPMSFTNDSFSGLNKYKKSLVRIPYISRSGKGKIFSQNQAILREDQKCNLDGKILGRLVTREGSLLPEYHANLRKKVLVSCSSLDVSGFFIKCLSQCLRSKRGKPAYLYVEENEREKERKISSEELNGHSLLRPPADWYYFLYLLIYTDGSRAMISTVDDNALVSRWFSVAIEKIKDVCGLEPLIIDVPCEVEAEGFRSDLSQINTALFSENWASSISMPEKDSSMFHVFESLEKQVLQLH